jgi:hypothetical protein
MGIRSDTIDFVARNSVQVMLGLVNYTCCSCRKHLASHSHPRYECIRYGQIGRSTATSKVGVFDIRPLRCKYYTVYFCKTDLFYFLSWQSYDTFLVSEISHVISDPSPFITRSPDVATIRIVFQVNPSLWTIVQDSREKSVLKGFSSVGGLWTALCGIFAVLFGSSILRVMFSMIPSSFSNLTALNIFSFPLNRCQTVFPIRTECILFKGKNSGIVPEGIPSRTCLT